MTLYRADNIALDTTTGDAAGVSFTAGAKVALQLQIPASMAINLVELGWTQDVASATATFLKLSTTNTGSTPTSFLSTSLVKPVVNQLANASRLTYAGSGATSGYGSGAITSRSEIRNHANLYVPQQYEKIWPLGNYPTVGNGSSEEFLQLIVNTTVTVNGTCWLVWDES